MAFKVLVPFVLLVAWSLPSTSQASSSPGAVHADDELSLVQVSLGQVDELSSNRSNASSNHTATKDLQTLVSNAVLMIKTPPVAPSANQSAKSRIFWSISHFVLPTNLAAKISSWNLSFIEPDIFPDSDIPPMADDGDEGLLFFNAASKLDWSILLCTCCLLAMLDQLVPYFRNNHRQAILCWILIAVAFNVWIGLRMGVDHGFSWTAGYILEWMLSLDNLFVFHLIFQSYQTPPTQRHKALFIGIIGAIGMRIVFFMAVSGMIGLFVWGRYFFGAFLIYSGIETARADDDDEGDVKNNTVVVLLRKCLGSRLVDSYDDEGRIFVRNHEGRLQATLLFVVIVCLEATDVVFAIDSVSAKVAQIPDQYIAFGSSALAMFGLRAMFFVVQELVDAFELMKYGLCLILVFIGLELMCSFTVELPPSAMCMLIFAVMAVCIAGSKARKKGLESTEPGPEVAEKVVKG